MGGRAGNGKKKKQIVGCSKKTELDGRKNMSGGYGHLTTLIPCDKTVKNCKKVPKNLNVNKNVIS